MDLGFGVAAPPAVGVGCGLALPDRSVGWRRHLVASPAFGGAKVIERLERLGDRLAGIERGEDVAIPVLLGLEVSRELRTERLVGTDQRAIVEDDGVQLDLQQRGISQRPILLLDELRQDWSKYGSRLPQP